MKNLTMTKLDIVKAVATFIVGAGTTKITRDIIANNTNADTLAEKVAVTSAAVVIGTMASEKTKAYTDSKIDEIAKAWTDAKSKTKDEKTTTED